MFCAKYTSTVALNNSISVLFVLFTVTLLDSMSAPGDLGWEAYPPEGVSTCESLHCTAKI